MNKMRILEIAVAAVLLVFLVGGGVHAQGPVVPAETPAFPEGPLGTRFIYQGKLQQDNNPVSDTCDLSFTLYDAAHDGNQVGSPVTRTNVLIGEGLFSVALDFGSDAFLGESRFMEIAVKCTGDAAFVVLDPRQVIAATPYALYALQVAEHDHWGESWSGSGTGLTLTNGDVGLLSTGRNYGVHGRATSTAGIAVAGTSTATSGTPYGVYGETSSPSGRAVYGQSNASTGLSYGVYGQTDSTGGRGLYGYASAQTGNNYGVYGETRSSSGDGVYGLATALSGSAYGVHGLSASSSGRGVYGYATSLSGTTSGVYGWAESTAGRGVYGLADANAGTTYGVYGQANSSDGYGVYGEGGAYGVYGEGSDYGVYGRGDYGLYGESPSSSGDGVYGLATVTYGSGNGVYGQSDGSNGAAGVRGYASNTSGNTYGVHGAVESLGGYGVYGANHGNGFAGWFGGNVHVNGALSKNGGSFKIDHPLDPANKYLYHSFVESPDMMNVYNGNVVLGEDGTAWVELSDWFQALNSEFRYQLTAIGAAAPNLHIARAIEGNRFQIAGGPAGLTVSWQVTGIRHDPWAEAHRIPVEEDKPAGEQGTYLHPELYGQPEELGIEYRHRLPGEGK
jgi:hypothetical protein